MPNVKRGSNGKYRTDALTSRDFEIIVLLSMLLCFFRCPLLCAICVCYIVVHDVGGVNEMRQRFITPFLFLCVQEATAVDATTVVHVLACFLSPLQKLQRERVCVWVFRCRKHTISCFFCVWFSLSPSLCVCLVQQAPAHGSCLSRNRTCF